MGDSLSVLFFVICSVVGAVLVFEGTSNLDASQTLKILGGAVLLSLGLTVLWIALKNWWQWRREYKSYRNE